MTKSGEHAIIVGIIRHHYGAVNTRLLAYDKVCTSLCLGERKREERRKRHAKYLIKNFHDYKILLLGLGRGY